jgi:3-hydroxyisobutyryl-CoA hydrolase
VASSINALHAEREPSEPPMPFSGAVRQALDKTFSRNTVEEILKELHQYANGQVVGVKEVVQWAKNTITMMEDRSPTSLRVALKAIRRGKKMTLFDAFDMELGLVSKFCVSFTILTLRGGAFPVR